MRLLVFIALLSYLRTGAQSFAPVSLDKFNNPVLVTTDTVHNILIASGSGANSIGNLIVRGVASWNGIKWDSLQSGINSYNKILTPNNPVGNVACGVEYNGKFLVAGYFNSMGNIKTTNFALWDGVTWDSLPKRAFRFEQSAVVVSLLKKGGLLYIAGQFDSIAGQPANGLATWDGINFTPITLPVSATSPSDFHISSIVEFQNEIYICGGFFDIGPVNSAPDVYKFNGTNWISTTGTGFYGSYDGIGHLIVYNNELYGCGHMSTMNGNPGNNIVKWDGSQWKDIGFGNTLSFINIQQMLVYHNKLWVFGSFSKVANTNASNIAMYDGTNWCVLPDTFDNQVNSATIYNDTIYVGGGFTKVNTDTNMAYVAKLKHPTLFSQCVNVGVNELENSHVIQIYPNPTTSVINIKINDRVQTNATIEFKNALGQLVKAVELSNQVDLSDLSNGLYFLVIKNGTYNRTFKIIKQ